ncbi:MAG: peptide-methionine (S)-S-oxide reductase MsrA [Cetobacterium sp.]|nr:peptide-methionine (S)-S-oxide reductase MsrA [Cetobacterium sp.]
MKKFNIFLLVLLFSTMAYGKIQEAVLAGGCFWCVESDLEKLPGVKDVISGYSGGTVKNPAYKEVSSGTTGHRESVLVKYDDEEINYATLLYYFLRGIDPTDGKGQFNDRGFQYSPAIFYMNENEKNIGEKVLEKIKKDGKFSKIEVALVPFKNFYPAEDYHQDYYKKETFKYKYFRFRSGRDRFIKDHWNNK